MIEVGSSNDRYLAMTSNRSQTAREARAYDRLTMKLMIVMSFVVACGSPQDRSVEASPPNPTADSIACGAKQCSAAQICIETSVGNGTEMVGHPNAPTQNFECAASPLGGGGWSCSDVKDRRQSCVALVPAAPPHG